MEFQQALHHAFGVDDYNVFVFGEFLDAHYDFGRDELQLAFFCEQMQKQISIDRFIREYLNKTGIHYSLILIQRCEKEAFFVIEPLQLNISMTDYYPEKLESYLYLLRMKYLRQIGEAQQIARFRKLREGFLQEKAAQAKRCQTGFESK